MDEGQAVGLLKPTQQSLAQATIALGSQSIGGFVEPTSRFSRISSSTSPEQVIAIAKRTGQTLMPVEQVVDGQRTALEYVRVADCLFADSDQLPTQPMLSVDEDRPYLATLSHMLATESPIARVTNSRRTVGYVTLARMQMALLAE